MSAASRDPNSVAVEILRGFDHEVLVQYVATYFAAQIRIADLQAFARFHEVHGLMAELRKACRAVDAVAPRGRGSKSERARRLSEVDRLRGQIASLTGVEPRVDRLGPHRSR